MITIANIAKALAQYDADAKVLRDAFIDNLRESLNQVLPCPRIEIIEYEFEVKVLEKESSLWINNIPDRAWKAIYVGPDRIRKLLNPNKLRFYSEEETQSFVDNYQSMLKVTTNHPPCPVFVRGYCPEENE